MLQFAINNNEGYKNNCWICRISRTALDNEWKGRSVSHAMQECFISHFLLHLTIFFLTRMIRFSKISTFFYWFVSLHPTTYYWSVHTLFLTFSLLNIFNIFPSLLRMSVLSLHARSFFLSKVLWATCFRRSEREGGDLSVSSLEKFTYLSIQGNLFLELNNSWKHRKVFFKKEKTWIHF